MMCTLRAYLRSRKVPGTFCFDLKFCYSQCTVFVVCHLIDFVLFFCVLQSETQHQCDADPYEYIFVVLCAECRFLVCFLVTVDEFLTVYLSSFSLFEIS